jgi:succinate-semialdehyde dehydrogenase/glutarate-semialdehyde dehydrogenase
MSGQLSPFISARQAEIVDGHIDDAVAKGAVIRSGGKSFQLGGGLYMRPTVLTEVTHDMLIMRDETFGPVIPIMRFTSEDEAVALANDTYYGLSAAVLAGTEAEALRIARRIDAGNVSVQDAFLTFAAAPAESDKFRDSGIGGKRSGIARYLRRQALLINSARPVCLLDQGIQPVAQGGGQVPGQAPARGAGDRAGAGKTTGQATGQASNEGAL